MSWEGDAGSGVGRISGESGAFHELPFTVATRAGDSAGRTNPEELLAAAHAGCYAMSLANELTGAGTPPERLDVTATVVLGEREGRHDIVASRLDVVGRVRGLDAAAFERAARDADAGCPFSRLIARSGDVSVTAHLA